MFEFANPFEGAKTKKIEMEVTRISIKATNDGDVEKIITQLVAMYGIHNYKVDVDDGSFVITFEAPRNLEQPIYMILGLLPKGNNEEETDETE